MIESKRIKRLNFIYNLFCGLLLLAAICLYIYHIYSESKILWIPGIIFLAASCFNWWRMNRWFKREHLAQMHENNKISKEDSD